MIQSGFAWVYNPQMANLYSHAEWLQFREDGIKLDGGRCVRCLRSRADGVVLQLHHKAYKSGRLPWQYGHDECETLCKGCHAEEHGHIMPRSDWELIATDDLGDLCGNCEYCDTELRYTFLIHHPNWGFMSVGTKCCDRFTDTAEASEHHAEFVRRNARRKKFVSSSRWSELQSGATIIERAGITVKILPTEHGFRVSLDEANGKQEYPTLLDARMKAFDLIESGEATTYLLQRRQKEAQMRLEGHSN